MYIQRHGESETNVEQVFTCRRLDPDLTALGRRQIEQNVQLYENAGVTHIISSPSKRAVQTAEILADSLDVPVAVDGCLLEVDVGDLEGMSENDPDSLRLFYEIVSGWLRGEHGSQFPGGESGHDVAGRLATLKEKALPTSLLVGHGGLFAVLMGQHGGASSCLDDVFLPRAGAARYEWDTESWEVMGRAGAAVKKSTRPWQD